MKVIAIVLVHVDMLLIMFVTLITTVDHVVIVVVEVMQVVVCGRVPQFSGRRVAVGGVGRAEEHGRGEGGARGGGRVVGGLRGSGRRREQGGAAALTEDQRHGGGRAGDKGSAFHFHHHTVRATRSHPSKHAPVSHPASSAHNERPVGGRAFTQSIKLELVDKVPFLAVLIDVDRQERAKLVTEATGHLLGIYPHAEVSRKAQLRVPEARGGSSLCQHPVFTLTVTDFYTSVGLSSLRRVYEPMIFVFVGEDLAEIPAKTRHGSTQLRCLYHLQEELYSSIDFLSHDGWCQMVIAERVQ